MENVRNIFAFKMVQQHITNSNYKRKGKRNKKRKIERKKERERERAIKQNKQGIENGQ